MYKLEITIMKKGIDTFVISVEGEDVYILKSNFNEVVKDALKERGASNGYFDAEMLVTENDEYFDSDTGFFAYVDGEVKVAPYVGLRICGCSNLSNLAIDYVELEMVDGTLTTLDWETSYWDGDEEDGLFYIDLPAISTTNDSFIDGNVLKNIKCINSIQVYSDKKEDYPRFSIDKIEILEDCVTVGEITKPKIKEIVYEF